MLKITGKLVAEAKPKVENLWFEAFFIYCRVVYAIFLRSRAQKWQLSLAQRTQNFREENTFFFIFSFFCFKHAPKIFKTRKAKKKLDFNTWRISQTNRIFLIFFVSDDPVIGYRVYHKSIFLSACQLEIPATCSVFNIFQ